MRRYYKMVALVGAAIISAAATAVGVTVVAGSLAVTVASYAIGYIVTTFAVTALLGALAPKRTPSASSAGSNRGYQTNTLGPAQDHSIIYGEVRVGGAIVFDEATGTNNKILHRVIAMAGHEINSFEEVYINDEAATIDSNGNVTSPSRYANKVKVYFKLGAPDQDANLQLASESSKWTTAHRLRGIAYMYVRLTFDADTFPNGIPTFTASIKGKKVYDPRNNTTAWSDNPALCLRDYLTSNYGLNENISNVDDALVTSAANVCDQTNTIASTTRYTCNGSFTTIATPYDAMSEMLKSMGGSLWYAQGKWRMKPAYYTSPVMTLNDDDLRSGIAVSTRHSRRDNFNVIKGTFRGEESNWQTTDYPQVTNSAFLVADNNQESVADVDLTFTDNSIEARRLALITLERNRQQLTVNASFGLRTLELQIGDNVRINNSRFGWVNKQFEVVQWSFGLVDEIDLQVEMTLRETAASVFDEVSDGVVYERDNTTLLSPFSVPTVGITANVVARVFAEKLVNELTLTITSAAPERVDYIEVQYKDASESEYKSVGTGDLGRFTIIDLEKSFYDVRARAINSLGIKGEYEFLQNIEVDALSAPPADITNFVFEIASGSLFLQWDGVPDLDLSYYQVRHSPLVSGATWGASSLVLTKIARPATNSSLPARSGTFLIKAVDKNLNYSVNATSIVVLPNQLPPLGAVNLITENPAFAGAKTNCIVVSNKLEIDNTSASAPTATYLMQNTSDYIDTGTSRTARTTGDVVFERIYDNGTLLWDALPQNFDTWPDLFDNWTDENAGFADVSVTVFVRATPDNPASNPTWGPYIIANGNQVVGRAFEFKAVLNSIHTYFSPSIVTLTGKVEF